MQKLPLTTAPSTTKPANSAAAPDGPGDTKNSTQRFKQELAKANESAIGSGSQKKSQDNPSTILADTLLADAESLSTHTLPTPITSTQPVTTAYPPHLAQPQTQTPNTSTKTKQKGKEKEK